MTTVLIGTTKGAFIVRQTGDRWQVSGPHCGGWSINQMAGCAQTGTIWAAGGGDWFGAGVWRSDDGGENWTLSLLANGKMDQWLANDPGFAEMVGHGPAPDAPFTGQIDGLWSLTWDGQRLYAGSKSARLFVSDDRGETWQQNTAFADFPGRESWTPGAAGLVLHTILSDGGLPARLWLGVSAEGVFYSEDGGASWERRNRLTNAAADHGGHRHPAAPCGHEIGHCVHNLGRAPGGVIWQQNHHGVFRSADDGLNWQDVTEGLPSTFGFPIAAHPTDPQTAWVLPLNGDMEGRFPPGGACAVWRTRDAGATWQAMRAGLPQESCFFTVLRQGMAIDTEARLWFGTNSGSVFHSDDLGESWQEIARHLPTVLSVDLLP